MKKYSVKKVLAGLAVAVIFFILVGLFMKAIKFFFRILLVMMENPIEALATTVLVLLLMWVFSVINKSETTETK
jgi:uncharacterized radical SAM superfamily protein